MPTPHVLILRAPGTNCDAETAFAFQQAGATTEVLHINRLLDNPELFRQFQILCIPGGFSYGDDLGAGRILGNQMLHHLADEMARFKADGKLILGICNGFQVLMKSPVLLDGDGDGPAATLTINDCGRYQDRWVRLEVQGRNRSSSRASNGCICRWPMPRASSWPATRPFCGIGSGRPARVALRRIRQSQRRTADSPASAMRPAGCWADAASRAPHRSRRTTPPGPAAGRRRWATACKSSATPWPTSAKIADCSSSPTSAHSLRRLDCVDFSGEVLRKESCHA